MTPDGPSSKDRKQSGISDDPTSDVRSLEISGILASEATSSGTRHSCTPGDEVSRAQRHGF